MLYYLQNSSFNQFKMENKNSDRERNKAQEPQKDYKTIRFFDSFEEMNEYDYQQYANMTPKERLQAVCQMRDAYWPEEKKKKPFGSFIFIKK